MTTCGFRFPISDCPDAAPEHAQQRASRGAECGLQQLGHRGGGHLKVRVKGMKDDAQGGRAMGVHEGVAKQLPSNRLEQHAPHRIHEVCHLPPYPWWMHSTLAYHITVDQTLFPQLLLIIQRTKFSLMH